MGRYRKQMLQLMMAKKELDTKPVLSLHQDHAKVCLFTSPDESYFHMAEMLLVLCKVQRLAVFSTGSAEPGGADL